MARGDYLTKLMIAIDRHAPWRGFTILNAESPIDQQGFSITTCPVFYGTTWRYPRSR